MEETPDADGALPPLALNAAPRTTYTFSVTELPEELSHDAHLRWFVNGAEMEPDVLPQRVEAAFELAPRVVGRSGVITHTHTRTHTPTDRQKTHTHIHRVGRPSVIPHTHRQTDRQTHTHTHTHTHTNRVGMPGGIAHTHTHTHVQQTHADTRTQRRALPQ